MLVGSITLVEVANRTRWTVILKYWGVKRFLLKHCSATYFSKIADLLPEKKGTVMYCDTLHVAYLIRIYKYSNVTIHHKHCKIQLVLPFIKSDKDFEKASTCESLESC